MPTVVVVTQIHAPIERCFDFARSVKAHELSSVSTRERVVSNHPVDLLALNDVVTFEASHLLVRQRLSARVVEFDRPFRFVDEMESGVFKRLRHLHEFREIDGSTFMKDTIVWTSPLGILGHIADFFVVKRHLRTFITEKQLKLRQLIEASVEL